MWFGFSSLAVRASDPLISVALQWAVSYVPDSSAMVVRTSLGLPGLPRQLGVPVVTASLFSLVRKVSGSLAQRWCKLCDTTAQHSIKRNLEPLP